MSSSLLPVVLACALAAAATDAGVVSQQDRAPATASTTSMAAVVPAPAAASMGQDVDVDALIASMSLEQKVGQLLFVGFGGTQMDGTIAAFLDETKPGAVALFSRNIVDATQTGALIRAAHQHETHVVVGGRRVSLPLFVAVDQEGGNVVRLKTHATIVPSAMALGAADDVELTERTARALGDDLRAWGFNMNLAPVLDVNSNPRNPVIGIRSFGSDPVAVGRHGAAFVRGLRSAGIVAVAKHFPGHGDTDADSHYHLPVLRHDEARLRSVELVPFQAGIEAGLPALMTAHIALPAIAEGPDVPATISPRLLGQVLRRDLGFDGLVITDGLEMRGIVDAYGSGEAAVRAVLAGADMVMVLWIPERKREVRQALLTAASSGRISQARLDEAVRRVLRTKERFGLFSPRAPVHASAILNDEDGHRSVVQEIARKAITVVRNQRDTLPLQQGQRVVAASSEAGFLRGLERGVGARTLTVSSAPTRSATQRDADRLVAMAQKADVVVIGIMSLDQAALVRRVRAGAPQVRVVVVSFASPYVLESFPSADACVAAFGWREESERAVADVLLGRTTAMGRLPVELAGVPRATGTR